MSEYTYGTRVRIGRGYQDHGKCGTCLGIPIFVNQLWLPVLWDDEEDPDFFKLVGIERLA